MDIVTDAGGGEQFLEVKRHLPLPVSADRSRIRWTYATGVVGIHALALLALAPRYFSWTGVALALGGLYAFGTLGINLCYHRLLTHRGYRCSPWLEHVLATLGVCCLQDTPARWVAIHRLHHQHSDDQPDPHSPLVSFFWGHMGWLFIENRELERLSLYERYAKDLLRDGFYWKLERNMMWLWIYLAQWPAYALSGWAVGWGLFGGGRPRLDFGASVLVWGVFVRTVLVWHITWSVNSVTHLWGYRRYETPEQSRNNVLVGLLSNGEGWHNNHHAQPRSAAHGHAWWELDVTYLTLRVLVLLGLAWDVVLPVKQDERKGRTEGVTKPSIATRPTKVPLTSQPSDSHSIRA